VHASRHSVVSVRYRYADAAAAGMNSRLGKRRRRDNEMRCNMRPTSFCYCIDLIRRHLLCTSTWPSYQHSSMAPAVSCKRSIPHKRISPITAVGHIAIRIPQSTAHVYTTTNHILTHGACTCVLLRAHFMTE